MKTVTITKGLPASGKTTWAKEQIKNAPTNSIVRVNKDDIRAMLSGEWSKGREKLVLDVRDSIIMSALTRGQHVIVDDTNLDPKHVRDITRLVRDSEHNAQVKIKDFTDLTVGECRKRNTNRLGTPSYVPPKVIDDMYNRYLKVQPKKFVEMAHVVGKPSAIMCDLDGTLALMGDRSPYDASTCFDDKVNFPVLAILRCYPAQEIVFLSGRSDKYEEETRRFLDVKCAFPDAKLYMRKHGDQRKDSIVKEELFRTHVADKYNIDIVLDDRNQVVEMWRSIGLKCFQVADGNF